MKTAKHVENLTLLIFNFRWWWIGMTRGLTKMLSIQLIRAVNEMYLHGKNLLDKQRDNGADAEKWAECNAS